MGFRKYILTVLLGFTVLLTKAQQLNFQQVDSATTAQFTKGNWKQLIAFSKKAAADHIDFPKLRFRIGYAYFSTGDYSAALIHYQQILISDSHNDTARYFSYLCNTFLGRNAEAYYQLSYLDTTTLKAEKLQPFSLVQAGIESGVKIPNNSYRGNATYTRVSLSARLGFRLLLDQSLAYFNQPITFKTVVDAPKTNDEQKEYYGRLTYTFLNKLSFIAGYHYFNTSYQELIYKNNAGLLGLKYTDPYFDLQGDFSFSHISGLNYAQYDSKLSIYPLGNLNLYNIAGFSIDQGSTRQHIFSELIGFKITPKLWMEGSVTFGKLNNYFEYDALYIYNAVDNTTFKTGSTLYYQLNRHASVYLNYTYEKKTDTNLVENIKYSQSSITGGLTWKF